MRCSLQCFAAACRGGFAPLPPSVRLRLLHVSVPAGAGLCLGVNPLATLGEIVNLSLQQIVFGLREWFFHGFELRPKRLSVTWPRLGTVTRTEPSGELACATSWPLCWKLFGCSVLPLSLASNSHVRTANTGHDFLSLIQASSGTAPWYS